MKHFLTELKRRQVVKPLVAYAGISWLVLQVVGVVADMITVHPLVGPGILLFLLCGFPVAVYLSWHFDFSLDGVSRTKLIDADDNESAGSFGIANWAGLFVIVSVSAFIGVQYFYSIKEEKLASQEGISFVKKADSIAILPFSDQSPDKDQAYLAVGLAEEITSLLGRSEGFKVAASRSSQILTERGLTPTDIGRRLEVQAVLTGSVRATGNRVRVRVELLDTETGRTIWTESFLREFTDIFAIESEISRSLVNLLQDRYLEAGDLTSLSTTKTIDAYVMYLKGKEEYRKQTTESMTEARRLFEQSIALDPEYTNAYVALADTITSLAEGANRFGVLKTDIAARLAETNLQKAIVREPQIAEIYAVMGQVKKLENKYEESLEAFDKALEINPNLAIAYMWKSNSLYALQRFDEEIENIEKAIALDPLFVSSINNYGISLSQQGKYEQAKDVFEQLKIDHPASPFSYLGLADVYFAQGNYVGSIREAKQALELSPENQDIAYRVYGPLINLGLYEILLEKTDDSSFDSTILIFQKKFAELFEKMDFEVAANPDEYWTSFEAGWYLAMFGDKNKAMQLIVTNFDTVDPADKFYLPYCSPAIEAAWAFSELGDVEKSQENLSRCEELFVDQMSASFNQPELIYLGARINALKGDKEAALNYLQTAINDGWREWWTKHDPLLSSISAEPQYQELITFIDDDLARQAIEAKALFEN